MDRRATIRMYREQTLNLAALITAIATARVDADSELHALSERQDSQLSGFLHDFAFRARKMIELAERAGLPLRQLADLEGIAGSTESPTEQDDATEGIRFRSFWWILGRIIHSDDFNIRRSEVQVDGDHPDLLHRIPWAFEVRSDRDEQDKSHVVFLDFFLEAFMRIDAELDRWLNIAAE